MQTDTNDIINEAKKLLFFEKLDTITDKDLEKIRENSVLKYVKHLEQFVPKEQFRKYLCNINYVQWNDNKFFENLPNPKRRSQVNKFDGTETILRLYFTKWQMFMLKIKSTRQAENVLIKQVIPKQNTILKLCFTKWRMCSHKLSSSGQVPELTVIPQSAANLVPYLEVRKININTENFENYDSPNVNSILRLCFTKWRTITAKPRPINRIDNFIETIQKQQTIVQQNETKKPKETKNLQIQISSYEHRFHAQKTIIQQQKVQLLEQKRIIDELQLKKIEKDVSESLEQAQNELRCLKVSRRHVPVGQGDSKDSHDDVKVNEDKCKLTIHPTKIQKWTQQLSERASARAAKHQQIVERKRMREEIKQHELAEKIARQKQKQRDLEENVRRQCYLARQLERKRQLEKKRYAMLNEMARAHHRKSLLKHYGLNYLKMLIFNVRIKMEIAKRFYENNLVMVGFTKWRMVVHKTVAAKYKMAVELDARNLKRTVLGIWKQFQYEIIQSRQVAVDRYEWSLQTKVFLTWQQLVCEYRKQYQLNIIKAEKHYRRLLLFQCFDAWRSFPALIAIARAQHERKQKWRLRVAEILTDYNPVRKYDFREDDVN